MAKSKLQKEIEEFFSNLGFEGKISIEEGEVLWVNFETQESSFLIGYHGTTLKSLAWLLKLKLGEQGKNLVLDINDYKKAKKERLENMAFELADKARSEGKPQVLPVMSAYERRLVHMALIDQADIIAESEGEEPNRRIVIKIKE